MPLIETKGAASAQGFGGAGAGASGLVTYIEDVFSTYLYTGNSTTGGTQTITNNIDLSTKGGMVWIKGRSAASDNILTDTTRGAGASATNNNALSSNLTSGEDLGGSSYDYLSSFSTTGFVVTQGGTTTATRGTNYNNVTYASWTFRKQPKFFDIVTFTSTASTNQRISHSLGSVPGCIIVKAISSGSSFYTYHSSLGRNKYLQLNDTAGELTITNIWGTSNPTSTDFGIDGSSMFLLGTSCVAYLFAHNAGGFGLSGTDNVISCGSFTGNTTVNLGYEPQWLLIKNYAGIDSWTIMDNMRGMPNPGNSVALLRPNTSGAEGVGQGAFPTATGFTTTGYSGLACIYIAIRRGPMKVPTSGTSVFGIDTFTGTNSMTTRTGYAFSPDMTISRDVGSAYVTNNFVLDRLRGWAGASQATIDTNSTSAEVSSSGRPDGTVVSKGIQLYGYSSGNNWFVYFARAPGFFDEVCYTGTGLSQTLNHNLGVVPELIISKSRSYGTANTGGDWAGTYFNGVTNRDALSINKTNAASTYGAVPATSTTFNPNNYRDFNGNPANFVNGATYVAYLFATCPGVSKVGSYTGTGALQTVDCGFTGGARFVLIKRTDSTGDWYVYDSARGISSSSDPYLFLNSTAAEVTGTNYVDTTSVGFQVTAAAPAGLNANGGTYIFLAIA